MKKIKQSFDGLIYFKKIKPFKNICPVSKKEEFCNIELKYIPNECLIEIVSYRKYFDKVFQKTIEGICDEVFFYIKKKFSPKYLLVEVFLEGNPNLTEWSCKKETKENK